MAYHKRKLFVTTPNGDLQNEMIEVLKYKEPKIRGDKIKQLVFEPVPMSKIRWLKWLTPAEMERYLVGYEEFDKTKNDDIDVDGI